MPAYTYQAMDLRGRTSQGVIHATGRALALDQIIGLGLHPTQVDEVGQPRPEKWRVWSGSSRISASATEAFTRELGSLLTAGVPLNRALQLLTREATGSGARKAWGQIHDEVTGGLSLADALSHHPQAFSAVAIAMVRAGEQGGFLDAVLTQIADFRQRERDLIGRVKVAMLYPAILAGLMTAVMIFLLTYFIPRFSTIFDEFGAALPWLTQVIVATSHGVRDYGLWGLALLVIGVALLRRAAQSDRGRRVIERTLLGLPGVGTVAARFAFIRFSRTFGTLLQAGVPLVAALRTAANALGNQTLHDAVARAIEQVQRGESLARSLGSCPQLFPGPVVEIIAIAEETGRLDHELLRLATTHEADLDQRLRMGVSMLEPLLLMMMAAIVGTIVVGMLLPLFTLQDLIK